MDKEAYFEYMASNAIGCMGADGLHHFWGGFGFKIDKRRWFWFEVQGFPGY